MENRKKKLKYFYMFDIYKRSNELLEAINWKSKRLNIFVTD
ncbi:hypothetical protein SAMN05444366_3337 [Flavobacterium saccharophilum]|uniref:Uncharacterized protein n=1 Tax=Flavobacterium saccharophilum TaxID=29534 RepID=A0A1M7JFP7_9FLAO|nr:hypothetical protein SAMN05444366_3337 [Flavobacterium saccharophilum]